MMDPDSGKKGAKVVEKIIDRGGIIRLSGLCIRISRSYKHLCLICCLRNLDRNVPTETHANQYMLVKHLMDRHNLTGTLWADYSPGDVDPLDEDIEGQEKSQYQFQ